MFPLTRSCGPAATPDEFIPTPPAIDEVFNVWVFALVVAMTF